MRLVGIEHSASGDTKGKHRNTREMKKRMGDRNITPKVALRHCRNILLSIDVTPSIRVVDIVIVCTRGGRTSVITSDRRGVDAHSGSTSATRTTEGSLRGGRRESIRKWRGYWTDQSGRRGRMGG